MANLGKGYTFGATESVTAAKLHSLVELGTVSGIVNADISALAAIEESKILPDGNRFVDLSGDQSINGEKEFIGDVIFSGTIDMSAATITGAVPAGCILLWSGAISAIPTGWALCDGNNGTPDLTDRFVIHADADSGGTNDVGDTGGAHTHDHSVPFDGWTTTSGCQDGKIMSLPVQDIGSSKRASADNTTGSADSRPKYYALAYIMKT